MRKATTKEGEKMFVKDVLKRLCFFCMISLMISLVNWHAFAQQGIVIDGKSNDWEGIHPVISDPRDVENGNVYDFTGELVETGENLDIKAVYATSDEEYLYLMVETYGAPDSRYGYSFSFDVNDDGIAEHSVAFGSMHLFKHGEGIYGPGESMIVNLRKLKITKVKYAIDRVFEARIPLSYLDNPSTISIGCKTNVWCFYCYRYNPTSIYIDSSCCGKTEITSKGKIESREKEAGIEVVAVAIGLLMPIGYLKKKKLRFEF